MASERQIAANRENAKKSTGPKTEEGKAIVSGNPVKHGLTAATRVVILDESSEQFERMHDALQAESVTGTELERGLIGEVAAAMWRLRRAARIERDMMAEDLRKALYLRRRGAQIQDRKDREHWDRLIAAGEMDPSELDEPKPKDPLADTTLLGEQVRNRLIKDDGYAKLGRYEVQLRRGLYQAVRELRMLRAQYTKDVKDVGESPRRPRAARDEHPQARSVAPDKPAARAERERAKKVERVKRVEKAEKVEKVEKVEKMEKAKKVKKAEKAEKAKKVEKATVEKAERSKGTSIEPRSGRRRPITPSRNPDANHEMMLADGSVVRID